jgi:DNA processing protein
MRGWMGELLRAPFAAAGSRVHGAPKHLERRARRRHERGHDPTVERERLWRLVWSSCPGIGWQRLERLEAMFGSLEVAWRARATDLVHALGGHTRLHSRELEALERYRGSHGSAPISEPPSPEQQKRWTTPACLLPSDLTYPEALLQLERPPLQLFWRGQGTLWPALGDSHAVAVVGTRHPSRHGLTMARQIGRALAEAGWPVVSGLAEGIDAAAHQGCLEAGGRPVGVLGTPLNRVYPSHHGQLQAAVAEEGLLISELAEGTPGRAGHFALRNRLQVGLVQALVLVECPCRSGALHSAELAWELGIPIWVVPADAGKISAAGSNRWLQQGATPLLNPTDLTTSLGAGPLRPAVLSGTGSTAAPLLQREAALLAALGAGASLDQLCERLRLAPGAISERLLRLELAGVLRSEPGLWWRPC